MKPMLDINKTTNINGVVKIEVDGEVKQVAFLSASVNVDGKYTSNRVIQDAEIFKLHNEEIKKDFSAFDDYVYEIAEQARADWEEAKKKAVNADAESTQ